MSHKMIKVLIFTLYTTCELAKRVHSRVVYDWLLTMDVVVPRPFLVHLFFCFVFAINWASSLNLLDWFELSSPDLCRWNECQWPTLFSSMSSSVISEYLPRKVQNRNRAPLFKRTLSLHIPNRRFSCESSKGLKCLLSPDFTLLKESLVFEVFLITDPILLAHTYSQPQWLTC